MQRIVRVGQYLYQLAYEEIDETPQIEGIEAAADLLLFNGAVPILYQGLEWIPLEEAARLSIDMEGKFILLDALQMALTRSTQYGRAQVVA